MILEGATRRHDLWKDYEQSTKALRKGMGIGKGKEHITSVRMASEHNGLASEDVRTRWPSCGGGQEMKAWYWVVSGHRKHAEYISECRQDAIGHWADLPDLVSD